MFVIESEQDDKVFSLFALIEPTAAVKERLEEMGGAFRSSLRCKNGQMRAGWLFSADKLDEVQKFIDAQNEGSEALMDSEDECEMDLNGLCDTLMDVIARLEVVERAFAENLNILERVQKLESLVKRIPAARKKGY